MPQSEERVTAESAEGEGKASHLWRQRESELSASPYARTDRNGGSLARSRIHTCDPPRL